MTTSSTPESPTKQQVRDALAALYAGRTKRQGYAYVRSVLQRHGAGAASLAELKPEFYLAVWNATAIVGVPSAEEFYGCTTDVPDRIVRRVRKSTADNSAVETCMSPPPAPRRIKSPLTIALEAELAKARAKTKRSIPTVRVNLGNASQPGDRADDGPFNPPSGQKLA